MSSGQAYFRDLELGEKLNRNLAKAEELKIPYQLGVDINELIKLFNSNTDNISYSLGKKMQRQLDKLDKYRIQE